MSLVNAVKRLCAHYLFNQWMEFDQTSTDTYSGWGQEMIRFWWPWPYFQGHYIINTQKVSLVNAVKGLCAHYLFNQLLVLLNFGDLDFIFKVTPTLWNLNFVRKRFYALCGGYRICAAYWQFSLILLADWRPWSDSADVQSDLNLCCLHVPQRYIFTLHALEIHFQNLSHIFCILT